MALKIDIRTMLPSQAELHRLFEYDPKTGILRWKHRADVSKQCNTRWCGNIAGSVRSDGYCRVSINCMLFMAHRLIWCMIYNNVPAEIDHINGIRDDNRIDNLREATHSENLQNGKKRRDNRSGFKGVYLHKRSNKFVATIRVGGHRLHLGMFDTPYSAYSAYCDAATKYHGDFARTE